MQRHTHSRSAVWLAALLVLMALPASAQVIEAGSDLWTSPLNADEDGGTYADFAADPIPPDFFCPGSPLFTDVIFLHGVPLVTEPAGVLAETDTIVERLADVPEGGGWTSIQIRALQMRSHQPIEVYCEDAGEITFWTVTACLSGAQEIGEMGIYQEHPDGGFFEAYLPVNVKLTFTQVYPDAGNFFDPFLEREAEVPEEVDGTGTLEPRSIQSQVNPIVAQPLSQTVTQSLMLNAAGAPWAFQPVANSVGFRGGLLVDTDCDGIPDTWVAGTSNFAGGWNPFAGARQPIMHQAPQHQHTVMPPLPSDCSCI